MSEKDHNVAVCPFCGVAFSEPMDEVWAQARHEMKNLVNSLVLIEYESTGNTSLCRAITTTIDRLVTESHMQSHTRGQTQRSSKSQSEA